MRRFLHFWWLCAKRAARGNASFANNFGWLVGTPIVAMLAAYIAASAGVTTVTTGYAPFDLVLTGAGAFAASWFLAFIVRLLSAPASLYHEQKDRADHFENVRQIANGGHLDPSFKIGFEVGFNENGTSSLLRQTICRIWVENINPTPIEHCRLVIEHLGPEPLVKDGAMLIPYHDHRVTSAIPLFNMAASEIVHFSFLELSSAFLTKEEVTVRLKTNEHRDMFSFTHLPVLSYGKQYFVTLAVHGDEANSARLQLMIDVVSETEVIVSEGHGPDRTVRIHA